MTLRTIIVRLLFVLAICFIGLQPYKGYTASPAVMTPTTIDELRVYNYQMSDAEVLALYQSYLQ